VELNYVSVRLTFVPSSVNNFHHFTETTPAVINSSASRLETNNLH